MQVSGRVCVVLLALLAGACSGGAKGGGAGTGAMGAMGGDAGSAGAAAGSGAGGGEAGTGQAGASGLASDELCGARPGGTAGGRQVLRFESLEPIDEHIVVQFERSVVGPGVGESVVFGLDSFQVLRNGQAECVTDPTLLEYENTHHNWFDIARGTAGDVTYQLQLSFTSYGMPLEPHLLSGTDADGVSSLGPIPMISTGSPSFCGSCLDSLHLAISEVMLDNVDAYADEAGEYEPWIELYNWWSEPISLNGWHLSDDFADRRRWRLPAVTIPSNERILVVVADGQPEQGELHTTFRLQPGGGQLILTDPDGRTDGGLVLAPQSANQSLSYTWSSGSYEVGAPTPGAPPSEP